METTAEITKSKILVIDDEKQILEREALDNYVTNSTIVFKQVPSLIFINESGLYSLILRSGCVRCAGN